MLKLFASEALGRARMMRIVEGTSEIQRLLIARGVLEGRQTR
jgi:alkylation response protein AidB-like acyl-CoA dehydrogenase